MDELQARSDAAEAQRRDQEAALRAEHARVLQELAAAQAEQVARQVGGRARLHACR